MKKDNKEGFKDIKNELISIKADLNLHIDTKINYLSDDIKLIKEEQRKFNNRHEIYEKLYDVFPVIETWVKNFSDDKRDVFTQIQTQLTYMKDAFTKNYLNGSHREKAEEILEKAEIIINDCLVGNKTKQQVKFDSIIFVFLLFLRETINKLIDELSRMSDRGNKAILIRSQFLNLWKTVYYLQSQYLNFIELEDNEIMKNLKKFYSEYSISGIESTFEIKGNEKELPNSESDSDSINLSCTPSDKEMLSGVN